MNKEALIRLNFPVFHDPDLIRSMAEAARWEKHEEETELVPIGSFPKWIPLVTKGAIKVSRVDEDGEELFLYYLYPGQTCALTLNCCMNDKPSEVQAVAETGTEYLALPRAQVQQWMMGFDEWRNFTLQAYDERYENLIATIDAIAFQRLDKRLLQFLSDKSIAMGSANLSITHKKLAEEMHSSREVISRLLKQLEKLGKVQLGRNQITLLSDK